MKPRTFNDLLALVLMGLIFGVWVLQGRGWLNLPEAVLGGLLTTFALIVQFYFRRAPPNGEGK